MFNEIMKELFGDGELKALPFKKGWAVQTLPILGKVIVIDESDGCKVGLSAMQMNSLGGGRNNATILFNDKTCICDTWNAMGIQHTGGDADIRLTSKAADKLGCKVGDTIRFVTVDNTIRPIKI